MGKVQATVPCWCFWSVVDGSARARGVVGKEEEDHDQEEYNWFNVRHACFCWSNKWLLAVAGVAQDNNTVIRDDAPIAFVPSVFFLLLNGLLLASPPLFCPQPNSQSPMWPIVRTKHRVLPRVYQWACPYNVWRVCVDTGNG